MRRWTQVLFGFGIVGALLFGTAGTIRWWNAWVYLLVMLLLAVLSSIAIHRTPGLAEERRTARTRAPRWDRRLVALAGLAIPVMAALAGFEQRTEPLPAIPAPVSMVAFCLILPPVLLTYRSIAVNAFFSSHVRIQTDRGQVVVATGPYGRLRHPGYLGAVSFNLLAPIALGSWLALAPGVAASLLLVWRTAREDALLVRELPGYADYAAKVRYKLIPGIW